MNLSNYIGIPYKINGRNEKGLDCYGLIIDIYKKHFSINLPDFNSSFLSSSDQAIPNKAKKESEYWTPVNYNSRKQGDVILFNIGGNPFHIGLILDQSKMIHTLEGHNCVIESYSGARWRSRFEGIYRWL